MSSTLASTRFESPQMLDMRGVAPSGVPGLDDVLSGGFAKGSLFLIEGSPGTGKTTLALRFLLEGAGGNERGLCVTLSETKDELLRGAASHGWTLPPNIEVFELQPAESLLNADQQQSLLYSSDLELGETIRLIFDAAERVKPDRIVLDSLSEIRLLAQSSLRYRRQLLAIKHYFSRRDATVLALDDLTSDTLDKTAHSIAHGVIRLEELTPTYGAERRRLRVMKYRGQSFRGGYHDFVIRTGGLEVFPRLVSKEHFTKFPIANLSTGNVQLDALLGGGIESGSSTLLLGPAGSGKSLLAFQCTAAAVGRDEKVALFAFDEELNLLFRRTKAMGIDLEAFRDQGSLFVEQVDAAELSPGEFAHKVIRCVEEHSARTVIIDSLNGYQLAMPEEQSLILHMHELLQFLNRNGAATFLTVAQHGLFGDMKTPVDVTYLADTVIPLRYFEAEGRVRRAISVVKKRTGSHEDTIRELTISSRGLALGEPLDDFRGVLAGMPSYVGQAGFRTRRKTLMPFGGPNSERILILAPRGRDAEVASKLLQEAGWPTFICANVAEFCDAFSTGAASGVMVEEALPTEELSSLAKCLEGQAAWSDFPLLVLTGHGDAPERNALAVRFQDALGNVSFLERPFHPTTLISVIRSALRSRRRQYQARELLERQVLLTNELQHRTKNLLAVIQAIALASLPDAPGRKAFLARLHALAKAQDLIVRGGSGALMADVVSGALGNFGAHAVLDGPEVLLNPNAAQGFALIMYELTTNAAKYGALSTPTGSVSVRWKIDTRMAEPEIVFQWKERGGPSVTRPERKGFGTLLLERAVATASTPPHFEYSPEGFSYELRATLAEQHQPK